MTPRAHTVLRLAAIAWIAVAAWVPRGNAASAKIEAPPISAPSIPAAPAAHALAPASHSVALARR